MRTYTVKRQPGSKHYGIYNSQNQLVEGGFWEYAVAMEVANGWKGNAL